MLSSRAMSLPSSPQGRHSSRRWQLEHCTLRSTAAEAHWSACGGVNRMTREGSGAATADMVGSLFSMGWALCGALNCGCELAEFGALVEKLERALREVAPAVGRARVVAEDDESHFRGGQPHGLHHFQAGSAIELHVEHDDVGMAGQDAVEAALRGLTAA